MYRRRLLGFRAMAALAATAMPAFAAYSVRIGCTLARTGLFAAAVPSQEQADEVWEEQVKA